jgi:hypothetical protein
VGKTSANAFIPYEDVWPCYQATDLLDGLAAKRTERRCLADWREERLLDETGEENLRSL